MIYHVKFNKEACMGCGACIKCSNWKMGDDGKAAPVKTELEQLGCNQEAADACPVDIIEILEVK